MNAILAALSLLSTNAFGSDFSQCAQNNIHQISVPLYPTQPKSVNFKYSFQLIEKDPTAPTVVYIPGGPGEASIVDLTSPDAPQKIERLGIPSGYNIVLTDPRTAGCNRLNNEITFPDDSLTSENIAHDVVSAIENLKLRKYFIYGISYGTELGTIVASMAEQMGLPAPTGVVLSGVIGKGFEDGSFEEYLSASHEWTLIRDRLSTKVRDRLRSPSPPEQLNIAPEIWTKSLRRFISRGLFRRVVVQDGIIHFPLIDGLKLLGSDRREDLENFGSIITAKALSGFDFSDRLYASIDCAEITSRERDWSFAAGEIVPDDDICASTHSSSMFNAKNWPIHAPIYYFQGLHDPSTPSWNSQYHFEAEPSSNRYIVFIPDGGHQYLGDYFPDCKDAMWDSMSAAGDRFSTRLKTCVLPTQFEFRPAQK